MRYTYTSLTTPRTTYDYDTRTGERVLLKREPVLGDFDPSQYATEYLWVPARDGERVPVAIVYRRSLFRRDGSAPLLQYGYGAYGISSDPHFSSSVLSLLDRGFVYAIAQVRGGQERGRRWYEAGRLLEKKHSFEDFIDVTRWLVAEGYADAKRVFARGGSAGGLLVAAAANMAPGLYRGIVAHVPFVDIVTTMLDESIPLTTNEYDEWGDPNERAFYDCMLGYSPYDNVTAQDVPGAVRHDGSLGQPGAVLRAREVGREAAASQDRRPAAGDARQHGGRPRRQVGPVRASARGGGGVRVHPRPGAAWSGMNAARG